MKMPKESLKKHNIGSVMEFNDNSSIDSPSRPRTTMNFKSQKGCPKRSASKGINLIDNKASGDYLSEDANGMSSFLSQYEGAMQNKRKKLDAFTMGAIKTSQQKVAELLEKQSLTRRENREKLSRNLTGILEQYQQDLLKMKENEEKLQKLLTTQVKAAQQATASHTQTILALKEMHASYEKQCGNVDEKHKSQRVALEVDLANEMQTLHQQLLGDSRKEGIERLRQTLLTEGLLRSGALKVEDRPIWWDIYRAFPPIIEPLYSRPAPNTPLKQIFYEEDNLRAKFHKSGQHLGTVKLSDSVNKSYAQKLIDIHTQLRANSADFEENLYEKCVATLNAELGSKAERQTDHREAQQNDDPRGVSAQIKKVDSMATPSLKDIFKE